MSSPLINHELESMINHKQFICWQVSLSNWRNMLVSPSVTRVVFGRPYYGSSSEILLVSPSVSTTSRNALLKRRGRCRSAVVSPTVHHLSTGYYQSFGRCRKLNSGWTRTNGQCYIPAFWSFTMREHRSTAELLKFYKIVRILYSM